MSAPVVGFIVEKVVTGLVGVLNDCAQSSVPRNGIYRKYRRAGFSVSSGEDIFRLDLREVDERIGLLGAKYKSATGAEGAATGAVGGVGIPVDVVALLTLNLRAIGEYGTYCGFDTSLQHERLYAMEILGLATSPDDAAKQAAMVNLTKIATDVARRRTWKELEEHVFVRLIQQIAKSLGVRLTKAKLAQVVPYAGAVVGWGFNTYYTNKVCDAAYYLYRERFLAQKYGEDIPG